MRMDYPPQLSRDSIRTKCEDPDAYEIVDVRDCVDILHSSPTTGDVLEDDEDHLTYRVVHLNCPDDISGIPGQSTTLSSLISNPLNGQVYIMTDPLTTAPQHRPIAPKPMVGLPPRKVPDVNKESRRKQTHNEIERKRRDKINEWITTLGKLIPDTSAMEGKGSTQSKGFILARACDYIAELRQDNAQLLDALRDHDSLNAELEMMKQQLDSLKQENAILKQQIQLNS